MLCGKAGKTDMSYRPFFSARAAWSTYDNRLRLSEVVKTCDN